ncbi:RNAse P Rpr2/Rpp21/SNM1 subunit domain-containing protein [Lipomyces arxii]|uniref:RNAse P Rpr2/Rpp21/SNM1 subunit domain-containing protein n=1 Tax=Lipomyces arxii TaxID=56418 RepID=UPI0034CEEB63
MAKKQKGQKGQSSAAAVVKSIKNKDQYLRISFLYQAAQLMANTSRTSAELTSAPTAPLSRFYASQMRSVARKNVIRLDPSIKRTVCKRCDSVLIPGSTCAVAIENESRDKVAHADVLTHTCMVCGGQKRYPVGMDRNYEVFTERGDNVAK